MRGDGCGRWLAIVVVLAGLSGYRAWVQVKDLHLDASASVLLEGVTLRTSVVTSGRTLVDVRLEMIQGQHAETLGMFQVGKNGDAALDPRSQRADFTLVLTPPLLGRFMAGSAVLRATARGRPQWLREPPPTIREVAVTIGAAGTGQSPRR